MKQRRLKPDTRKEDLLAAALLLAEQFGYAKVTRGQVCKAVGVSGPVLNYHFGTMAQFRRDLMRHAVKYESLAVVAQGLTSADVQAQKAPEELRRRAAASLFCP